MRYHTVRQGLLKLHELFGNSLPVYLGAVLHSGELGASIYPDLLLNGRAKISEEWSDFSAGIQSLLQIGGQAGYCCEWICRIAARQLVVCPNTDVV